MKEYQVSAEEAFRVYWLKQKTATLEGVKECQGCSCRDDILEKLLYSFAGMFFHFGAAYALDRHMKFLEGKPDA